MCNSTVIAYDPEHGAIRAVLEPLKDDKMMMGSKTILRAALLITASVGVSGCVYDVGLGYASDGYYDDGYACDAYGSYDAYYDCDYGQGFANIGFGGGWYDNYYYPGYGFFLFDQVGRRYPMRDHHRRYWGEKRQFHSREHRSRDRDGRRYDRRQRGYTNDATPGVIGPPERNGGRVRDGDDSRRNARRENRRSRTDQWQGGEGRGANALPVPNPEVVRARGARRDRNDGNDGQIPRANGGESAHRYGQRPAQSMATHEAVVTSSPALQPRAERIRQTPRRQIDDAAVERPK